MLLGPLKRSKATCASSGPVWKAFRSICTASLAASQPASPMLPLPSNRMTTSSFAKHCKAPSCFGLQGWVLHRRYCNRKAESDSGHEPIPVTGVKTWRSRTSNPLSQALEQVDQPLQGASWQSRSQASLLQLTLSEIASHGWPPKLACTRTSRTRSLMPPPQCALQELQPPHSSNLQSTGQCCSLHFCCMTNGGQATPRLAGTTTDLVNSW
mmetsp:Transcript_10556/g.32906  ORF Transcript_10556/g.32906 Transcript_10556/m.32906 type:complete len:211 (+) Transcript_10556:509-1141(+)